MRVALTFDDGPAECTGAISEVLATAGARATFFVIGRRVRGREAVLTSLVEKGHELGNHSMTHPKAGARPFRWYSEIAAASREIERVVGLAPALFRPPWGQRNAGIALGARFARVKLAYWDVNSEDWKDPEPTDLVSRVLTQVTADCTVLLHDGEHERARTLAALPHILDGLAAKGAEFVHMSALRAAAEP